MRRPVYSPAAPELGWNVTPANPKEVLRQSAYLTHPIFSLYHTIVKVAQVDFLAQRNSTQFLSRYIIGQSQTKSIEEYLIYFFVAQLRELFVEPVGNAMNALCYFFQTFGTVPQCVETSHGSQQRRIIQYPNNSGSVEDYREFVAKAHEEYVRTYLSTIR